MRLSELKTDDVILSGLSQINIILGRNGAGKSSFLRSIDSGLLGQPQYNIRYISPERAGVFRRDGYVLNSMEQDKNWLRLTRGRNQVENFKAASANLLRELELAYLRRLESNAKMRSDPDRTFQQDRLEKINRLLSNLSVAQEGSDLVFRNSMGDVVPADQISSGESESVALGAEIMHFFETLDNSRFNVLLLDEPDVHLHPDLQARLARLIVASITEVHEDLRSNLAVCIATHSTPLVCALAGSDFTTIGTKDFGVNLVHLQSAPEMLRKAAPFFGHPLSLSLSNDILLIVEGEDDERVWQQAARSSQGRIRVFPVVADSVDQQTDLERACVPLLNALYDSPLGYSLRDGDGVQEGLPAVGPITRFRLQCYAIENLLATDETLSVLGKSWPEFQDAVSAWLVANGSHRDKELLKHLVESPDRLRNTKIKPIRQLICAVCGSAKPWEVVVGQAIGSCQVSEGEASEFSLQAFLGSSACLALLPSPEQQ